MIDFPRCDVLQMSATKGKIPKRSRARINFKLDHEGRRQDPEAVLLVRDEERRHLRRQHDAEQHSRRLAAQRFTRRREEDEQRAHTLRASTMLQYSDNWWDENLLKTKVLSRKAGFYHVKKNHDPSSDAATRRGLLVEYRDLFDRAVSLRDELRPRLDNLRIVPQKCQYLYRIAEEVLSNLASLPSTVDDQVKQRRSAALNMRHAADVIERQLPVISKSKKRRERRQKTKRP